MELLIVQESIAVSVLFIVLGTKLRKNYTGKVRTLGIIFLVYSIVLALFLMILAAGSSGLDMEDNGYYDEADRIWQVVVCVLFIIIGTFVSIFPWWYESKLLIEGTKHVGVDEDSPVTVEYQSNDGSTLRSKESYLLKTRAIHAKKSS